MDPRYAAWSTIRNDNITDKFMFRDAPGIDGPKPLLEASDVNQVFFCKAMRAVRQGSAVAF